MCLHNTKKKNNTQWLHDGDITHDLVMVLSHGEG